MTKTCTKCGYIEIDDSMDFCPKCGSRFKVPSAVQQTKLPLAGAAVMLLGVILWIAILDAGFGRNGSYYFTVDSYGLIWGFAVLVTLGIIALAWIRKSFWGVALGCFTVLMIEVVFSNYPSINSGLGIAITLIGCFGLLCSRSEFT